MTALVARSPTSVEAPAPPAPERLAAVGKLRSLQREFGLRYAALAAARQLAAKVPGRLDDALLAIEGRRGVLGPAHRRWSQHSVTTNREVWSGWDWGEAGEEWSGSPEWKTSLVDEVLIPATAAAGMIVEIGPGAGRWTEALVAQADELILVDITDTTLELCRRRLGDPAGVTYLRSDGASLHGVPSASVDAVWSFDAFVHIAPLDVAAYLREIARVLKPGGVAVIHHTGRREPRGWRSPMGAVLFARLAEAQGLEVRRQFDSWAGGRFSVRLHGDVLTELRRPG